MNIEEIKMAYGGVGPSVIRLKKCEQELTKAEFTEENIIKAINLIPSEITPISDVRGSKKFRIKLAQNLFKKFFRNIFISKSLLRSEIALQRCRCKSLYRGLSYSAIMAVKASGSPTGKECP